MNNIPHIVDTGASHMEEPRNNVQEVLIMASTDALLYGAGFVKITNHPTGMTIGRVPLQEFLQTAEQMKWIHEQALSNKEQNNG